MNSILEHWHYWRARRHAIKMMKESANRSLVKHDKTFMKEFADRYARQYIKVLKTLE